MENIENPDTLKAEIKSILACKAKEGATFRDVKDEYAYLMGKKLCFDSEKQFNHFLRTMADVYSKKGAHGHLLWFNNSAKSKHVAKLVRNQKPPREYSARKHSSPLKRKVFYNSTGSCYDGKCYYNDNYIYKNKRVNFISSLNEPKRPYKSPSLYNYELVGDDFFLNIVHKERGQNLQHSIKLGFKGRPISMCGYCASGQSIRTATNMVRANALSHDQIILNIGSVDLLHGRNFIQMRNDFMELYAELENRGIHTVITTVAPLANMLFSNEIQTNWQQFNMFLLSEFPNVIDITCCFVTNVNNTNQVRFSCYEREARYVTGSKQAHLLWNRIGREGVLSHLRDSLAELLAYQNSIFDEDL